NARRAIINDKHEGDVYLHKSQCSASRAVGRRDRAAFRPVAVPPWFTNHRLKCCRATNSDHTTWLAWSVPPPVLFAAHFCSLDSIFPVRTSWSNPNQATEYSLRRLIDTCLRS